MDAPASPSNTMKTPLRFALFSSASRLAAWQARCLRELRASSVAELVCVIRSSATDASPPRGRFWPVVQRFLIRSRSLATVDVRGEISGIPTVDIALAENADLDFILNFENRPALPALRSAARYGVWSYDHLGWESLCGVPETRDGTATTVAELVREFDEDKRIVLRQGVFKTQPHALARTQDAVLFGGAEWPRLVCTDIINGHDKHLNSAPSISRRLAPSVPKVWQGLRLLLGMGISRIYRILRTLFWHPLWNIGVVDAPIDALLKADSRLPVQWFPEPADGTFIADPFALASDGPLTILYEDFYFHDNRGRIACVSFADGRPTAPAQTVFDRPFHMSYPYLFQHEGAIYCIPEAHESDEVVLYQAVDFPTRWRKAATLLSNFPACDSTVFQHEGRWWLACTNSATDSNLKLYLFHSLNLLGPWQPHAGNPVKTDVTSSRPAGTPFRRGGALYRPSQDSSGYYGGSIVVNRVERLTPTEFAEVLVGIIEPDPAGPYPSGFHTITECGGRTLVDGRRFALRPRTFTVNLLRLIRYTWKQLVTSRKVGADRQSAVIAEPVANHTI
jgi:hypothetical protein